MKTTKIAILGLGLIGGSLGMALRAASSAAAPTETIRVSGYARRRETAELAVALGAVDSASETAPQAVEGADFVFICTPVLQMLPMAAIVLPHMKPGSVLTDAGSTKQWFAESVRSILPPGIHYIGGHPMAGREKSGLKAAMADLFKERWYLFTPSPETPMAQLDELRRLIGLTGAMTAVLDEANHDRITAVISHLPHIAAAALVHLLKNEQNPAETARFIGGGFRDTTRIASSDADMWADICVTNSLNIYKGIADMKNMLEDVARLVSTGDRAGLHAFFSEAKNLRDSLLLLEKNQE